MCYGRLYILLHDHFTYIHGITLKMAAGKVHQSHRWNLEYKRLQSTCKVVSENFY